MEEEYNFLDALDIAREGFLIKRVGWEEQALHVVFEETKDEIHPHFTVMHENGQEDSWLPSETDFLADDWVKVTA